MNPGKASTKKTSSQKEYSLGRTVIWLEALIALLIALSVSFSQWELSQVDIFNQAFAGIIILIFLLGLALFRMNRLKLDNKLIMVMLVILAGTLMVAYSTLMYQNIGSDSLTFMALIGSGAVFTIIGVGLLVTQIKQATRLTGYYSLWLFGLLLILFMPLHELGISYSPRDLLVGYLGLGISLIGSISFAIEQRLVLNVESWVTSGDAKYISEKYDEAIEYYDQALEIEPKNDSVWSSRGAALLKLGMWAKAVDAFDEALAINSKLALAYSGKGLALTHLRRYSEAIECHDNAIRLDSSPVGWNNKGNTIMRGSGEVDEAIQCYQKALKIDQKYEIAWFNKGKAELQVEKVMDSIKSFTKAVELKPQFAEAWFHKGKALSMSGKNEAEALYCFDTAIELKPANSDAWMERKILLLSMKERKVRPIPIVNIPKSGFVYGQAGIVRPLLNKEGKAKPESGLVAGGSKIREGALRFATQGNYDQAIEALDRRLAISPDDVVTHMTRGVLLSRIEKFDDALESFNAAIKLKPEWVGPLFSKAMILASKAEYEDAMNTLEQVTDQRPNYADAWSVKGIILGTQRNYEEAIQCFDKVIEIKPNNEDAWRSKSTALNKLGRYEEAIKCYEGLAGISPAMEETHRVLVEEKEKLADAKTLFRQGVELAKTREYEKAVEMLETAIKYRPNYVDAIYISGVTHAVMEDYATAMERFESVLELRPDHVEALYGKANILLKVESYELAIKLFDMVLELNEGHVDAWCDRGIALTKLGQEDEALECYDRTLKLAGDHPQAITMRERCVQAMKQAGVESDRV